MLLRVAGHAEVERRAGPLYRLAVGKETLVEPHHLANQVRGVLVAAGRGREEAILLGLVAAQQQQARDAEKLQVEQFILDVLHRRAAADDVGHHRYAELVLYCCRNGYGARAAAYALAFEQATCHLLVDVLAVVCGYVDEQRAELPQLAYRGEEPVRSRAFQRRQHLEGEVPLPAVLVYQIRYCHIWCMYIPLQNY